MAGHIDKIISAILIFALMVFVPLTVMQNINDLKIYRVTLNECQNLLDVVIDQGKVSEEVMEEFYIATAELGVAMNVEVRHYMKILNPSVLGKAKVSYHLVPPEDITRKWSRGDKCQIRVKFVDYTSGQKITKQFLGFTTPRYEITLSGRMRKDQPK